MSQPNFPTYAAVPETHLTRCPTCAAYCCQSMFNGDRGRHNRHPFVTHDCTCDNGYVEVAGEAPDGLVVFGSDQPTGEMT